MRKRHLLLWLALGAMLLVGCSRPKINAKDENAYRSSLEKMRKSLNADRRQSLDEALEAIFADGRRRAKEVGDPMGELGIMLQLDEMTADDIIKKGSAIGKTQK